MSASLEMVPPRDYVLARDVCSYGYFVLEPNRWDPRARTFRRVLSLPGGAATLIIEQPAPCGSRSVRAARGRPLIVSADRALTPHDADAAREQLARMLRLDEDHLHVRRFHRLDPRWRASGRARLLRSPTLFEDVIKTVTSCNVTWPGTVSMNRRLCEVFGDRSPSGHRAFPSPRVLARQRPSTLRARCAVGYRDGRIVELAKLFARGKIDEARWHDQATPDAELLEELIELPGVGPYAAHNILQLLGRYGRLPLDTESVRHGRSVLGFRGNARTVMKRVDRHFAPFGDQKFRSYWFELWTAYEQQKGRSDAWEREGQALGA
ncbi:MAG: hypothetical protein AB7K52_09320 [Phycisphaerales bacterium]